MANTVKKNRKANVGTYSYKYTDLAQIHDYLESIGETYFQYIERMEGDDYVITVRNIDGQQVHLRGARVVDATLQGVKNPAQEEGSAITYARRYSLLMAFGLATEDDDAQVFSRPKNTEPDPDDPPQDHEIPNKASDKQIWKIKQLYTELELAPILARLRATSLGDLTVKQASDLIQARKDK